MPLEITPTLVDQNLIAVQFIRGLINASVYAKHNKIKPKFDVNIEYTAYYSSKYAKTDVYGVRFELTLYQQDTFETPIIKIYPLTKKDVNNLHAKPNQIYLLFTTPTGAPQQLSKMPNASALHYLIRELDYETYWGSYKANYWINIWNILNEYKYFQEITDPKNFVFEPTNNIKEFYEKHPNLAEQPNLSSPIGQYYPLITYLISQKNANTLFKVVTSNT